MRHLYMDTRALYYDSNDGIPRDVKNRLRTEVKPDRENRNTDVETTARSE